MENKLLLTTPAKKSVLLKPFISLSRFISKNIKIHYLFILLFGYTGLSKMIGIEQFQFALWTAESLRSYYLPLSWAIPLAELATAVLLVLPSARVGKMTVPARRIGLHAAFVLMVLFTVYLSYTLVFLSDKLPCSCGGIISQLDWPQHLILNIVLSLLALKAIVAGRRNRTNPSSSPGESRTPV